MLEVVTMREIEKVFAVTDALGIHRESIVIPLAPGRPGGVRYLGDKLRITLDADADLDEWLAGLADRIAAARR